MIDFLNKDPIDDEWMALDLLVKRWGDNSTREIVRYFKKEGPYIEIGYHHDFSASTWRRFTITNRVAEALLAEGLAAGKPEWGYTDMKILRATDFGETRLYDRRSELGLKYDQFFTTEDWLLASRGLPV